MWNAFAGDVATFVNLGFSPSGEYFAFGEYGLVDKTYQAYASLYLVDVKKNEFVPQGIFRTSPTVSTAGKESKSVFLALQNRANAALNKYHLRNADRGRVLYSQAEDSRGSQTLFFKDFKTASEYTVVMHTEENAQKEVSFYITVTAIRQNGVTVSRTIGRKGYVRPRVNNYALRQVLVNSAGNALAFVVEKHQRTSAGVSIRYMIETVQL